MAYHSNAKRRVHPADLHDEQQIAKATKFYIHFRKGQFETYNEERDTLREAREVERELNKQHGQHGRRAAIYALAPDGARIFVPDHIPS